MEKIKQTIKNVQDSLANHQEYVRKLAQLNIYANNVACFLAEHPNVKEDALNIFNDLINDMHSVQLQNILKTVQDTTQLIKDL